MPDLFRLKGESYEKEIYIFSKYTIPVQISEAASPCRRSASCFHNAVYSVFRTSRKILIFYRKPGFYRSLCRYPFPSFSGKPDLSIFQRSRARSCGSSILSFRCAAPLFCRPFTGWYRFMERWHSLLPDHGKSAAAVDCSLYTGWCTGFQNHSVPHTVRTAAHFTVTAI